MQDYNKLIEKLEEQKEAYKNVRKNTYCRRTEMNDCDSCKADHYLEAKLEAIDDVIEIIKAFSTGSDISTIKNDTTVKVIWADE